MNTNALTRQDWLTERARIPGVGASESSALFGLHPNISAFSLFEKLVNPKPPTDEEIEEESDVQSFGLAIEPYLADWYARKTGQPVVRPKESLYRFTDPAIFASPDRFILTDDGAGKVLELKSAIYFRESEPLADHWQVQLQQQLLCTDMHLGCFAILGGFRRRYHVDDIPRNDAFCAILIETIDRFMRAVQCGSWDKWGGDIDGSKMTTEALRQLYPRESGTVKALPAAAVDWANELEATQAEIGRLQHREEQLKNMLRLEMADSTYGQLIDGSGFSLKTTKGSTYEVTKPDYRALRRIRRIPKGLISK